MKERERKEEREATKKKIFLNNQTIREWESAAFRIHILKRALQNWKLREEVTGAVRFRSRSRVPHSGI